jgi:hypothetical protein
MDVNLAPATSGKLGWGFLFDAHGRLRLNSCARKNSALPSGENFASARSTWLGLFVCDPGGRQSARARVPEPLGGEGLGMKTLAQSTGTAFVPATIVGLDSAAAGLISGDKHQYCVGLTPCPVPTGRVLSRDP